MRLTYWTAGTVHRIYATGVEGTIGKTYFTVANRRLTVIADDFSLPKPHILAATLAWLGLPEGTSGQDAFDALKERSAPPRSAARQAPAPSSSRILPSASTTAPITRLGMAELSFQNIRNAKPIHIEIDHREPPEFDAFLAQVENCTVTRTTLEVADFRLNDQILVERKSAVDFKASVEDGRLFDQAQRIGFTPDALGIVLLEGDVFLSNPGMLFSATTGAISCLSMVQGLTVFNTLDLRHSAYAISKLAQHHRNGLGYELPLRKDKPKQLFDAASYVLEGVSGVSAGLAAQLLRHFGSLQAVANASEAELKAVKGIGPKTATSIVTTFRSPTSR